MNATRLLSSGFAVLAAALVLYGPLRLVTFGRYAGKYYDERLVLFDSSFYPFAWGTAPVLIGQIARFHYQVCAMLAARSVAIVVLLWKRFGCPVATC